MNAKFSFLSLLLIVLFSAQISIANESAAMLARKVVSEDPAEAKVAIEELRALGPEGLEALLTEYVDHINVHIKAPRIVETPEWERIATALDQVGQQKNNYISGLYWYTDLDAARKVARESGKPILSLRLLGNLTDDLSCANSRFFRTVLYPNAQVRDVLRNRFVLHWKSVRPAPRITVDFGDGRKLERTVTGNSIHYILDSDGRLVEAIPGLYGPQAFKRELERGETLARSLAGATEQQRVSLLQKHCTERSSEIFSGWTYDTKQFGDKLSPRLRVRPTQGRDALTIGPIAATKMSTESPMVRAITSASDAMGRLTDEEAWRLIARLHQNDAVLDERSRSLMTRQNRSLSEKEWYRMFLRFSESIAMDTVRNEYMLRPMLYSWLASSRSADLEKFNEWVYAEVFATPSSDPWLGLVAPEIYVAVDNGGATPKGQ